MEQVLGIALSFVLPLIHWKLISTFKSRVLISYALIFFTAWALSMAFRRPSSSPLIHNVGLLAKFLLVVYVLRFNAISLNYEKHGKLGLMEYTRELYTFVPPNSNESKHKTAPMNAFSLTFVLGAILEILILLTLARPLSDPAMLKKSNVKYHLVTIPFIHDYSFHYFGYGLVVYAYMGILTRLILYPLSVLFDIPTVEMFDNPFKSLSVAEFWGRRWNVFAQQAIHEVAYQPLKLIGGRVLALVGAFGFSAAFHELFIWALAGVNYSFTGEQFMYFGVQLAVISFERMIKMSKWCPSAFRWVWTLLAIWITSPLFLNSFIRTRAIHEFLSSIAVLY